MALDPNLNQKEQQKFRGDSPDDVCVAVCNSDGSPIAGGGGSGGGDGHNEPALLSDHRFWDGTSNVSSGTESTILTTGVLPESTMLTQLQISCRKNGVFRIKDNGTVIGQGLLGAGNQMYNYTFIPPRNIASANSVTITYEQTAGGSGSDVIAFLQGFKEG